MYHKVYVGYCVYVCMCVFGGSGIFLKNAVFLKSSVEKYFPQLYSKKLTPSNACFSL